MLLKELELINFRQYKGQHKLSFSIDKEKNVTVILGDNTSGKTTLVQAFYWILYGKANFKTSNLLNLELANDLEPGKYEIVKGTLKLIHDDIEYKIIRKQECTLNSKGNISPKQAEVQINYKLPDGTMDFIKSKQHGKMKVKNQINKILPEDLAAYFLFDGERISNLAKNNRKGRKDLANAVKSVLGLDAINEAIKHLKRGKKTSVLSKFKRSLDLSGNKDLKRKQKRLEKKEDKLEEIEESNYNYEDSIEYYKEEIEKKEEIIKSYKETSELKKEMQKNESEIKILKNKKAKESNNLVKFFSKKAPMFFMQPLLRETINEIDDYELTDEGIPEMHAKAIDFLIKRGECICGEKIEEGNEKHKKLLKQKNYLPPESIGTVVRLFMNNAKHYKNIANDFFSQFEDKYNNFRSYKSEISYLRERNDDISQEIDGKPDVGKYEKEVREYKRKLKDLRKEKEEKLEEKIRLENEINRLNKDIKELASKSNENQFIYKCIAYTEEIIKKLTAHYSGIEKSIRKRLEKRVNKIFSKMYHGDRKIKIDSNYDYNLETPDISESFQDMADESKGLETVTSFAFISGIISLAREKIEDEVSGVDSEPYPLIMDAPFSNADEHHIENVSDVLPNVAEQVIMFIMHKDWGHAEKKLGSKLNKLYELDKKSETYTEIKEEKNV